MAQFNVLMLDVHPLKNSSKDERVALSFILDVDEQLNCKRTLVLGVVHLPSLHDKAFVVLCCFEGSVL